MATTPKQFLHANDGDLDLTFGLRTTPDLVIYVRQKIDCRAGWFLGEWFLDQRKGVPYFRSIIGQRYDRRLLDTLYGRVLQKCPGVGLVKYCQTAFDNVNRKLAVAAAVQVTTGEVVPIEFKFDLEQNS